MQSAQLAGKQSGEFEPCSHVCACVCVCVRAHAHRLHGGPGVNGSKQR